MTVESDQTFIGSIALMDALYNTYVEHIGIPEAEGPGGPYMWCACGWRSDDLGPNDNPGNAYAIHLTNAQHAAAVKALQPLVVRKLPEQKCPTCVRTEGYDRLSGPCPTCHGDGVIPSGRRPDGGDGRG